MATSSWPVVGLFDSTTLVEQIHVWSDDDDDNPDDSPLRFTPGGFWRPQGGAPPHLDPPTHAFRLRTFAPNGKAKFFTETVSEPFELRPWQPTKDNVPHPIWNVRWAQVQALIPCVGNIAVAVCSAEWEILAPDVARADRYTTVYWYQVLNRVGGKVVPGISRPVDPALDWDSFTIAGDQLVSPGTLSITVILGPMLGAADAANPGQLGAVSGHGHDWLQSLAGLTFSDGPSSDLSVDEYYAFLDNHAAWGKVYYDVLTVDRVTLALGAQIDVGLFLLRTDGTTRTVTILDDQAVPEPYDAIYQDTFLAGQPRGGRTDRPVVATEADSYVGGIGKRAMVDARLARYDLMPFDGNIYLTRVFTNGGGLATTELWWLHVDDPLIGDAQIVDREVFGTQSYGYAN